MCPGRRTLGRFACRALRCDFLSLETTKDSDIRKLQVEGHELCTALRKQLLESVLEPLAILPNPRSASVSRRPFAHSSTDIRELVLSPCSHRSPSFSPDDLGA